MARKSFPKVVVSTIITFIANRMGFEPMLTALGIGPNAIRPSGQPVGEDTARGLRLLWAGAAVLAASILRFFLRELAGNPFFALVLRICDRRASRQARS
jgi:hypothetical protein